MKKYILVLCFLCQAFYFFSQSNVGFELGTTSGWNLSEGLNTNSSTMGGCCSNSLTTNYAVIVAPGVDPYALISMVPSGGGNFALRLGKLMPSGIASRATFTFNVSAANPIFTSSYALLMSDGSDSCDQAPYFNIRLKDALNNTLQNTNLNFQPQGGLCINGDNTFMHPGNGWIYKNWSYSTYDLTNYIGTTVEVEFTVGESTNGSKSSYAYIDCKFSPPPFTFNGVVIPAGQTSLSICQNSSPNNLCAPAGFSYNWTGPGVSGQTGQCVNVTSAGIYSVTLTQGSNVVSMYYNVTTIPVPVLSFSTTPNTTCIENCDGSLIANNLNSTNCSWNLIGPSSSSTFNANTFIANTLCGGTYTLSVQENGAPVACSVNSVITISGSTNSPPSINPSSQTITCMSPTVTLNANPTSTVNAYDYIWTGPGIVGNVSTQTVSVSQVGTYTLAVTNTVSGCSITKTVVVNSNTVAPNLSIISTDGGILNCGSCVGLSASITGTPNINGVSFLWQPILNTTQNVNVCTAGIYTLDVIYSNGCSATATTQVTLNQSLLNVTVTPTIVGTCSYINDGSIETTISPANAYTFNWTDSTNTVISTNQNIYNLPLGMYYLNISDGTSCVNYTYTISSSGVNCSSMSGHIFNDINNDCINNTSDLNLSGIKVLATPGNYWGLSDVNGNYTIYAPIGNYTLSQVQFPNSYIAPNCVSSLSATISNINLQVNNLDFSDTVSLMLDGKVYNLYSQGIVPGFNGIYSFNVGYNIANAYTGILKFVKPSLLSYTIFNPTPLSTNGDTAYYNINLQAGVYQQFLVGFSVPSSLSLGLPMQACALLHVNGTDINLSNNTNCYTRLTSGSFDPNDKSVSPAGVGAEGFITANDSILTYTIRFQNTGTGPAVNVVIKDTLSPNLNATTFEMLASSHNYNIDVLSGNVLRWNFSNIMLPDSNTNEPASHGFVKYRIKQNAANVPGTEIKNTAYIYFDFNEHVITNTTINTLASITSITEKENDVNELVLFPNPVNDKLYIKHTTTNNNAYKIIVLDVLGKEVLHENYYNELNVVTLNTGVYFVKVVYANGMSVIKKVVKQ